MLGLEILALDEREVDAEMLERVAELEHPVRGPRDALPVPPLEPLAYLLTASLVRGCAKDQALLVLGPVERDTRDTATVWYGAKSIRSGGALVRRTIVIIVIIAVVMLSFFLTE